MTELMGNPDWHVSTVDNHFGKFLWVYCPGHAAGVIENNRADRLAEKATITNGLRLGRSEVLRNFETLAVDITPAPCQGHHTIDRLENKGVAADKSRKRSTISD